MTGKSLKEQNAWVIRGALLLHIMAFAYVALEPFPLTQFAEQGSLRKLQEFLAPGSLSLAAIALAKLVLLGLIPGWVRDRLVHWRWSCPLPGARAFTKFGPADQRVDMKKLQKKYGRLPTDPEQQSLVFYKIYKAHANAVGVLDAHKSYLAARDIATINLILLLLLPAIAGLFIGFGLRVGIYAAILFGLHVLMCVSAQVYSVRLVENTLAIASN